VLTTYFRSWVLIAFIIALRFLVDFLPFLLEVISVSNSGSLAFQAHLKLMWELSFYSGNIMHTFFEQLAKRGVEKGVDWL
jgi:hypothetical protein